MILLSVELGDDCIIGVGAVVTKSFPAGSLIMGEPAKAIRKRHVRCAFKNLIRSISQQTMLVMGY